MFKKEFEIYLKTILAGCAVAVLNGCAIPLVPNIDANGKYQQIYIQNNLFSELEYDSPQECADAANLQAGLDANARQALSGGQLKYVCSYYSNDNVLIFHGSVKNSFTNKIWKTKFPSKAICEYVKTEEERKNSLNIWTC
jgi:hypothetical protein